MIAPPEVTAAQRELGVGPGDDRYVHSGMQGAVTMEGTTREEKMDAVIAGLAGAVPEGRLMMPTYTYSFTRGEPFDVAASPSTVGMLTEHFRHRPDVRRTVEPIFSSAILGPRLPGPWEERLFTVGDVTCFGEESQFAYLYEADAALLFFGVSFEYCTYLYLVEQRLEVPYRYLKDFHGEVVADGEPTPVTARYYVRRLEEDVKNTFTPLAGELLARGLARELRIPRGPRLFVTRARAAHNVAVEEIRRHGDYLLTRGH
jgi:aminoglycoside 3-N-acetyltransferase